MRLFPIANLYGSSCWMDQNHIAHDAFAEGAADPAPPSPSTGAEPFASEAEETAYWQGVADGIRQSGGTVPARLAARAAKEHLLVPVHDDQSAPAPSGDVLDFAPVPVAHRHDGWTPAKQRAFVEALADTGIIRQAAATVGMTEQSVNRLRRRADARAFDRACDAAARIGARRIHSIAYERAIEGTIRGHYFHGELKAEERVYDNRLLIALLNRLPDPLAPDPAADEVAANWETWMEAIEEGVDPSLPRSVADEPKEYQVWLDGGDFMTNCPPGEGFDGFEDGVPGDRHYQRVLTEAEAFWWDDVGEPAARECQEWGATIWLLDRPTLFPWGSEPSSLSPAAAGALAQSQAERARDERARTAGGSAEPPSPTAGAA